MDASERDALEISETLEDYVMAFASSANFIHDEDHEGVYSYNRYKAENPQSDKHKNCMTTNNLNIAA